MLNFDNTVTRILHYKKTPDSKNFEYGEGKNKIKYYPSNEINYSFKRIKECFFNEGDPNEIDFRTLKTDKNIKLIQNTEELEIMGLFESTKTKFENMLANFGWLIPTVIAIIILMIILNGGK